MKFSVLMSVYHKEKPQYFNRAMQSIWDEQTIKPNEIVLVEDGVLNDALYEVIDQWQKRLGTLFKTIVLKENVGLGDALNVGLSRCSYEIVARMDTDDIALSNRFEKQLKIFEDSDIDICSSWISEFDTNENQITSFRKLPQYHDEIVMFAKKRSPLNHPAVMYKKEVVLQAGGYKKMMWFEDYYLWVRMILNKAKFYNIQEPLVKMRAGKNQLQRRRGILYAKAEKNFLQTLYKIGFLSKKEYFLNLLMRTIIRIAPEFIVIFVYKLLRKG